MSKPKVIAFYLPQYHPTPDNDEWWGKGFTEWTNVGKAAPLFKGHYQPKVPADLGYYDLRLPEVREEQTRLAKEAGVNAFCYYHYWFGNGKEELELPFDEVLRLGKPDFPFMLCWANESWHKKFWNKDGVGSSKQMLIEQTYPGPKDVEDHFYRLLPAFMDKRYLQIKGKPAFMIYCPEFIPDLRNFIESWNSLAMKNGLTGIYFMVQIRNPEHLKNLSKYVEDYRSKGVDAVNVVRLYEAGGRFNTEKLSRRISSKIKKEIFNQPYRIDASKLIPYLLKDEEKENYIIPTIIPNWDHTPRSQSGGIVFEKATPEIFKIQTQRALELVNNKEEDEKIIFLKSWNEWGEGNYMEPDLKFGKGFIHALRSALDSSLDN